MPFWTMTRLAAVHRCPVVPKPPHRQPSTASSRSASSRTMIAFLPPISRWTFLNDGAAASFTSRPVAVDPVNETTRMAGWRDERRAGAGAVAGHEVDHAGRQAGVGQRLHEVDGRERRLLGRLEHHGVAADQGREDLPGGHRDREVPGGDQPAQADRLADRHRELVAQLGRRRLAVEAAALAGHQLRHVDGFLHVAAGLGDDLAHLARHVAREPVLALGEQLRRPEQDVGPLRGRHLPPRGVGLRRRGDGPIDVGRARRGEAADQVAGVGRAAILERLARGGRDPLAIDEVGVSLYAHGLQFYVPGQAPVDCRAGGWMGRTNVRARPLGCGRCGLPAGLRPRGRGAAVVRPAAPGAHLRPGVRDVGLRRPRAAGRARRRADHRRVGRRDPLPRDPARGRRPAARLRDLGRRRHVAARRAGRRRRP